MPDRSTLRFDGLGRLGAVPIEQVTLAGFMATWPGRRRTHRAWCPHPGSPFAYDPSRHHEQQARPVQSRIWRPSSKVRQTRRRCHPSRRSSRSPPRGFPSRLVHLRIPAPLRFLSRRGSVHDARLVVWEGTGLVDRPGPMPERRQCVLISSNGTPFSSPCVSPAGDGSPGSSAARAGDPLRSQTRKAAPDSTS